MKTHRFAAAAAALIVPAALLSAAPIAAAEDPESPALSFVGRYANGGSEVSAALGDRLYVIGEGATLDIVNISTPSAPVKVRTVDLAGFGASITSVAATEGRVAVAMPAVDKTDNGAVVLLNPAGSVLRSATVGANPDMLTFDPTGKRIVVANEGEPNSYRPQDDPDGSVSIISVQELLAKKVDAVRTVGFTAFNVGAPRHSELPAGVRVFGPGASVAQDLEPEYAVVEGDTAFVTLQENNAIAEIGLASATVTAIRALAAKDHSQPGNGLDASDRDNGANGPVINIANWPVFGLPLPDGLASFTAGGETYLISANEGDARQDWPGYEEEIRVGSSAYRLDPTKFPNAAALKNNAALGRLTVSKASGDTDGDGDYDRIEAFGTRSVTIWTTSGEVVWDSGDMIERATAAAYPLNFNASNTNSALDDRSDNKGPEPEGVTIGVIGSRTYAFVGLERIGGFIAFDITDPTSPTLVQYANSRDFSASAEAPTNDSGPEVIEFVSADDSPSGVPLVIVNNEISHTVSIWSFVP